MKRASFISFGLLTLALAQAAVAQPVLESFDRFEMNWSSMRLRYFGESAPNKSLEAAEKEATDQGLLYALANVPKVRGEKGVSDENAEAIAKTVSKQSFVYNTIFFSNGKVRVELEASLALALDPGRRPYQPHAAEGEEGAGSSVIVDVKGLKSPLLLGEIRDNAGDVVYSSEDVSPDVYRKQLIGRWFYNGSSELKSFAGNEPVHVDATYQDGKLVVDKEAWDAVRKSKSKLLGEGKVAFVLPSVH